MLFDKYEFHRRLEISGENARKFATEFVVENLPEKLTYCLPLFNNFKGQHGPKGMLKYIGGRFLKPEWTFDCLTTFKFKTFTVYMMMNFVSSARSKACSLVAN